MKISFKQNLGFKANNAPAFFPIQTKQISENTISSQLNNPIKVDKENFRDLNRRYALEYLNICNEFKDSSQDILGLEILKLVQQFLKEEISYAQTSNINILKAQKTSLKELKESANYINKIILSKESSNQNKSFNRQTNVIAFNGIKKQLTYDQKLDCRLYIHVSSLICGGISAASGEFNAFGTDIPGLLCTELMMFDKLRRSLNVDQKSALLHFGKHAISAGMAGAQTVKAISSWLAMIGHPIVVLTTAGAGTLPLTVGLRAAHGVISSGMCEYMGWSFVNDYKCGKMNQKQKGKELAATIIFSSLLYGFNNYLDLEKPAQMLQDKALKALGHSIYHNLPNGAGCFIQAATNFLQSNTISYAAKGIELITPAIAANVVENGGKVKTETVEQIIKGSVFSLVCSNLLGENDVINEKALSEKGKHIISMISQDKQICEMIDNELIRRGIRRAGNIILDKETIKLLEALYNELTPKLLEIIKTKGVV